MTAIDPFADVRLPGENTPVVRTAQDQNDQFGKDTFLKLLVAQLRFQNPLSPTDPTEFLAQTAQFTMVEKLQEMTDQSEESLRANQTMAAASMIGRTISFGINSGETPVPVGTTKITLGGSLAESTKVGSTVECVAGSFNSNGAPLPFRMVFKRLADPAEGGSQWELKVMAGNQQIGQPKTVTFDATGERISGDLFLTAAELDQVVGSAGTWPPGGIAIAMGSAQDSQRVRVGPGSSSFNMREQNGTNGQEVTGIVTGIRFDPVTHTTLLRVGDREVPMTSITEVHAPELSI
jgi:flagellar basal-body rod modification protein FlgD